jgi:hypothetical protein
MTLTDLYRISLSLYPSRFRREFAEEMISVFEQRAGERFANRNSRPIAFFLMEFSGLLKGALTMWLAKILPSHRNPSSSDESDATGTPLTIAEVSTQRAAAIKLMCASIAKHDFNTARRYSDEETRLKHLLEDLTGGISAARKRTA